MQISQWRNVPAQRMLAQLYFSNNFFASAVLSAFLFFLFFYFFGFRYRSIFGADINRRLNVTYSNRSCIEHFEGMYEYFRKIYFYFSSVADATTTVRLHGYFFFLYFCWSDWGGFVWVREWEWGDAEECLRVWCDISHLANIRFGWLMCRLCIQPARLRAK